MRVLAPPKHVSQTVVSDTILILGVDWAPLSGAHWAPLRHCSQRLELGFSVLSAREGSPRWLAADTGSSGGAIDCHAFAWPLHAAWAPHSMVAVLKCTQDLFKSDMVRHADVERVVTVEDVHTHRPPRNGRQCAPHRATQGSTGVGQEAEIRARRAWPRAFTGVFVGRMGEAGQAQ